MLQANLLQSKIWLKSRKSLIIFIYLNELYPQDWLPEKM